MRRLLAFLLFSTAAFAQSTTVSTTGVIDSNGTTWANGSYRIDFQTDPYHTPPQYTWSGGPFSLTHQGSLDTNGAFSISLPSNDAITPAGSKWKVTVCPNAAGSCYGSTFPVIGPTMDITSALNQAIKPPSFPSTPQQWGYADVELLVPPNPGATYYNTTTGVTRCWTGSTWTTCSGAGGSSVWSALTNPTADLSLTMGAHNSAFASTNNFISPGSFISPWQFPGNGINFASEWNTLYASFMPNAYPSDELDVGIAVPNTSTAFQSNGIGAFVTCAQPNGNHFCVASYAQARRAAANSFTHAFNANVNDNNFAGGYQLFGGEFDSQVFNVGSGGATILLSANIYNANTPYDGLDVGQVGTTGSYRYGLSFTNGTSTTAINIGTAPTGNTSMPVAMTSAAGTGTYSYDGSGNFSFSGPVVATNTPLSPGNSVTDNFARAAGGLGANWSGGSTIAIVSSGVVGSTSGSNANNDWAWYTGSGSFVTNQCSSVTIQTTPGPWVAPTVNNQSLGNSYALLAFDEGVSTGQWTLLKLVAGAGTTLVSQRNFSTGGRLVAGDVIKLCNSGGTLTAYRNGNAEASTATDSTFTGGYPGFGFNETSAARISSFTGTGLSSNAVNIGGTFAAAGCTDFTAVTVTNAATTMACVMTGQGGNPANVTASCAVTAANTVTPRLCSFTAQTVASQNYTVRVIP